MPVTNTGADGPTFAELLKDGLFVDGDWVESKDQDPDGDVRLIQLADVGDGVFRDRSSRFLTSSKAKELRCTFLEPGDILIARMPEPLGRACIFPGVGRPAVTVVDVCVVRPNPERAQPEWLVSAINSPGFRAAMQQFVRGTTRQRISRKNLGTLELCVPALPDQHQVVAALRQLSDKQRDAAAHVTAGRQAVERFRQAVLGSACTGLLTADWRASAEVESAELALAHRRESERLRLGKKFREPFVPDTDKLPEIPERWAWAALPELGELGRGKSKHRPRNDPKLYGGEYPFIQTGDVARSGGLITSHSQTYNETGLAQSRLWPTRTVCITIAANIADSGLLTFPACFPDSVVGLVADENVALPEYVELFVRTARTDLATFAPATAQANINLAILAEVAVAVPPIEEQREIIRRTAQLFQAADALLGRIQAASKHIDRTFQAILAKAFRGELVGSGDNS